MSKDSHTFELAPGVEYPQKGKTAWKPKRLSSDELTSALWRARFRRVFGSSTRDTLKAYEGGLKGIKTGIARLRELGRYRKAEAGRLMSIK